MRFSFLKCACAFAVLAVAGLAAYTLSGADGIAGRRKKTEEIRQLERRNAELTRDIELRRQRIRHLQENPDEQELEIRRQMKLVHPGEKVFILQDPAPPKAAAPAAP